MYFMCLSTNVSPSLSLIEYIVRVLYSLLLVIITSSFRSLIPSSDLKKAANRVFIVFIMASYLCGTTYIIARIL